MIVSFIFLFCLVHAYYVKKDENADWILSFIGASIVWVVFLYGITEMLSVFHMLTKRFLACIWIGFSLLLIFLFMAEKGYLLLWSGINRIKQRMRIRPIHVVILLFALYVLYLSFNTVPYNYDSMTYHLSRICHWTQNKSISHYATNIIRQVTSPVLYEFVDLHVYILLDKKDNFLNLVQCVSYLISAGMVYGIARKLHCRRIICLIAALLYLAMPIAFAEALTTQNDNFATVWLLYFSYILIDFIDLKHKLEVKKSVALKVCMLGVLVGVGYLTKPSICIGMFVMVLWLLLICIARRDSFFTLLKLVSIAIPSIILPLIPEVLRNIKTFDAISDPIAGQRQLIGTLKPFYLFVNFLKNFLYNFPNIYIRKSDYFLMRFIEKIAEALQVNLNDPSISEDGREFVMHMAPAYSHDIAINPLIVWLMIFFVICSGIYIRKKNIKDTFLGYSFMAVMSFLIFCSVLRWEPYVTRYMSAYLALMCPMIGLQLEKMQNKIVQNGLVGVICLACIAEIFSMSKFHQNYVYKNESDRAHGYFVRHVDEYEIYSEICQIIRKKEFRQVGLKMQEEDYEYPLWKILEEDVDRIEHIFVENTSQRYDDYNFTPDCIIWVGGLPEGTIERNGKIYNVYAEYGQRYYLLF